MNIATSTTIAQLSLLQATNAGPSTSLNPTSVAPGAASTDPAGSSQAVAGSSFDAVFSSVTTRGTTNSTDNHSVPPATSSANPATTPTAQPSAGIRQIASPRGDANSNSDPTQPSHKPAAAKAKSETSSTASSQLPSTPTVVDVPIPLPIRDPAKFVPSVPSAATTPTPAQGPSATQGSSAQSTSQPTSSSTLRNPGTPTSPQPPASVAIAALSTTSAQPTLANDPSSNAKAATNQGSVAAPSNGDLDQTKAQGLVETATLGKQGSVNNSVASAMTTQSVVTPPVPVVSTTAAAVATTAQTPSTPPNAKASASPPTDATAVVPAAPNSTADAIIPSNRAINSKVDATSQGQSNAILGLNTLDSVVSASSTTTSTNQTVITNLMNGITASTNVAAFVETQQPGTSHDGQKKGDTGNNPTTLVSSTDARTGATTSVVPLANMPLNSSASSGSITSQLTDAVMQRIHSQSSGDQSSVVLRLNPPELGKVNVHVSMANDVVSIRLVASDDATRQLISGQQNDLRQSLSDQGITLSQFQVDSGGGQSFDQGTSRQSFSELPSYGSSALRTPMSQSANIPQASSRSLLNYVA